MTFRLSALVATLWGAIAAAAPGDALEQWTRSFEVNALTSHIQTLLGDRFLVVASNGEAALASRALESALRATRRTQLVIDSAPLGDVSKLDDPAIVKKASYLPVDVVLIVRIFGDVDAVITAYDRFGATIFGLTAVRGVPMKGVSGAVASGPRPSPGAAAGGSAPGMTNVSEGASGGAIASINRIRQQAEARFNTHYIEINDYKDVWGNVRYSEPVQGSQQKILDWPQFYKVIGRKDLHDQYQNNFATKMLLSYLVGPGLVLGSLAGAAVTQNLLIAGIGAPIGLVLGMYGVFMGVQPVDDKQRRQLAEEYNASLKAGPGVGLLTDPETGRRAIVLRPPLLSATFTF